MQNFPKELKKYKPICGFREVHLIEDRAGRIFHYHYDMDYIGLCMIPESPMSNDGLVLQVSKAALPMQPHIVDINKGGKPNKIIFK